MLLVEFISSEPKASTIFDLFHVSMSLLLSNLLLSRETAVRNFETTLFMMRDGIAPARLTRDCKITAMSKAKHGKG